MSFKRVFLISMIPLLLISCDRERPSLKPMIQKPEARNQKGIRDPNNPKNVSFKIEAKESEAEYIKGRKTKVWAYNGIAPGPVLNVNVGDTVTIQFINSLPEPCTMHWHGLELPANMDGSHISQKPVPPGGSFTYRFKVFRAATYWYHSHVKPNEQVEKGLQGMFIVHDPEENRKLQLPKKELNFVLDDVLLDKNYQLEPPLPEDPMDRSETLANGRIGNYVIINGQNQPTVKITPNEPLRLRFVNSSNSKFFRLSIPNQYFYKIGGDTGLLRKIKHITPIPQVSQPGNQNLKMSDPDPNKGLLLVPGERAEILWVPTGQPGENIALQWHDFKRGRHKAHLEHDGALDLRPDGIDGKILPQVIMNFRLDNKKSVEPPNTFPVQLRHNEFLNRHHITNEKPLRVMFGHSPVDSDGNIMFFAAVKHHKMGDGTHHMMPIPFKMITDKTALNAEAGEVRLLEVTNMTMGVHPFHMHGFPFQLIETEYQDKNTPENNKIIVVREEDREWKDTIPIPARPGRYRMESKTIMRFLIRFSDDHRASETLEAHGGQSKGDLSGGWMVHCHILEHAAFGMATWLNIWFKNAF